MRRPWCQYSLEPGILDFAAWACVVVEYLFEFCFYIVIRLLDDILVALP